MKDRDFPGQLAVFLQPCLLLSLNEGLQGWRGFSAPSSSWFSHCLYHSRKEIDMPPMPAEQEETSAAAWEVMSGAASRAIAEEKRAQSKTEPVPEPLQERQEPPGMIGRFERLIERVFRRQPKPPEK
jgi:hypothetical protein